MGEQGRQGKEVRGEQGRGRVLSVCQWLAADWQRGEIAVDYQRHPGTRGYFTTTHPPANQKMLSTENLQRLDFSNLGENGQGRRTRQAGRWPLGFVPPPFTAACWGVASPAGEQSVIYTFIARDQGKNLYPTQFPTRQEGIFGAALRSSTPL